MLPWPMGQEGWGADREGAGQGRGAWRLRRQLSASGVGWSVGAEGKIGKEQARRDRERQRRLDIVFRECARPRRSRTVYICSCNRVCVNKYCTYEK